MASVEKRVRDGRVTWLARWRDAEGRQRKRTFERRKDAEEYLTGIRAALQARTYVDPAAGKITLETWAATWLKGLGGLRTSTRTRYEQLARVHVLPALGRRRLDSIRPSDVDTWVTALAGSGPSASTVRQAHRVLALMLAAAVDDTLIARNPAKRTRLPKVARRAPRFLTGPQLAALVAAAPTPAGGFVIRALGLTGLRFGELAALRVDHVDTERWRMTIARSVTEVGGHLVWSDSPKTGTARSVPIPPSLRPTIADLVSRRAADALLFTAPKGGPLRLRNWRAKTFDPACEAVGLDISPHDLRHTAASLAIAAGANVKEIQRLLGHQSAAMTLDVYAGLFEDHLDSVAELLDSAVPPPCPEPEDEEPTEDL